MRVDDVIASLQALVPPDLRPAGEAPRFRVAGHGQQLDLAVSEIADGRTREVLAAIFAHPIARTVRRLGLTRAWWIWPRPTTVDFGWILDALADLNTLPGLDWLFVSAPVTASMHGLSRFAAKPLALVTWNLLTRFGGLPFPGIELLDLRDTDVEWTDLPSAFPDLRTLILRPRGPKSIGARWTQAIFARPDVVPALRDVRAPEHCADEIVERLVASPLLGKLRVLDCTEALTNRGAEIIHKNAARFEGLEELWIASTDQRRRNWVRFARDVRHTGPAPLTGELEITDDWNSRLRQRLGRRLRFEVRPGHPNL